MILCYINFMRADVCVEFMYHQTSLVHFIITIPPTSFTVTLAETCTFNLLPEASVTTNIKLA